MNSPTDRPVLSEREAKIAALNDQFRQTLEGGHVLVTPAVTELPVQIQARVFAAIQAFDDFNNDNDPYGTHEFGSVEVEGQDFWFKIDAYDETLEYGSPDPADPDVTTRVMTILTPSEY